MNEYWPSDASEARRLAILASYPVERRDLMRQLDSLAKLAAELCNTPIGLVSLVKADRQRFIGRAGTDLTGTAREYAFCDIGRLADEGMIVPDARQDDRFRDNPLVTGAPGIPPLRRPAAAFARRRAARHALRLRHPAPHRHQRTADGRPACAG